MFGATVILSGTSMSADTFTAVTKEVKTEVLSYCAWRIANFNLTAVC
jgi:hypothetical protein